MKLKTKIDSALSEDSKQRVKGIAISNNVRHATSSELKHVKWSGINTIPK
jgi:hypothetical protein